MDVTHLIESLRQDLLRAAEIGGEETRAAAERLLLALDPALRLTLMEALSQAAAEIGQSLPGVGIDVRLKGREPVFVVEGAPRAQPAEPLFEPEDDEAVARITLRLPEALKTRAEALAAGRGQSLNTWLVAAARAAAADGPQQAAPGRHGLGGGRHIKGWAR
jgi:hypothetical protein